jgi:hypothetical protein
MRQISLLSPSEDVVEGNESKTSQVPFILITYQAKLDPVTDLERRR